MAKIKIVSCCPKHLHEDILTYDESMAVRRVIEECECKFCLNLEFSFSRVF